jgi:hypothetical protein
MNSSYQYSLMIQEEGQTVVVVCRNRNIKCSQTQLFVMTTPRAHNGIDWIL